jgi:uncharacterized membrane protein YvbJ
MNLCASCGTEIEEGSLCQQCEERIQQENKHDERK